MNLLDVIGCGELDAEIVLVVASRPCAGVDHARARGLDVRVIPGEIPAQELESLLDGVRADWIVLAGYLRLVHVPDGYTARVVNIHPALLPAHGGPGMYGVRVHRAVLDAGDTETGCTVHICDERFDHGPTVLQRRCRVLEGDTVDTLAARVFELECGAYPQALRMLIASNGPIVRGGRGCA